MTIKSNTLRDAIKIALCVGASTMMGMGTAFAQDATPTAGPADATKAKQLDTITVTGSRVRRVDTETANPVLVLDRKAIEKTGKMTIGEIVNELPSISGAPVTAAVNNGGGIGNATADVRGLGSTRTLVLIDGHRPGPTPVDLNSIPLELVERIEVLTEGSSTVYGSDAIGGVINFIMRKNYNGAQFSATYGESGKHDSERKGESLIIGQSGDKGNVVAGVEYNKFDAVPAGNRRLAAHAYNLSYSNYYHVNPNGGPFQSGTPGGAFDPVTGALKSAGSSRNPAGRINLPSDAQGGDQLRDLYGCSSIGLPQVANPAPGYGSHLSDYQCFGTNGITFFDYQPLNIILTPQERTNAFAMANYNLTDDITAYLDVYHQKQTSSSQIAPLPFDANVDGVGVSANSFYNPFGIGFGPDGATNFRSRFVSLGQRIIDNSTTNDVVFVGLKGNFGQTWSWDAGFDYNHFFLFTNNTGYPNYAKLRLALGPSFKDPVTGVIECGTPGNVIANCTPINLFDTNDPNTIASLQNIIANPFKTFSFIQREVELNASGDLFDLPAGAIKLAVGGDSRREYQNNRVDSVSITNGPGATCDVAQEACSSPLVGAFNVKEVYAELFIPILKDAPGAYALNLDLGNRYSKYNIFSGNDSSKVAIEWRPIKDLLVRGSASDIFRAPSAGNLFGGSAGGAPGFNGDPCVGANAALLAAHPRACGTITGIPSTTVSGQTTGLFEGSILGGQNLGPEKGRSYDFGVVYDPQFVQGLSTSFDFYRITLNNLITQLSPNVVMNDCFHDEASPFCSLIHRQASDGGIAFFQLPVANIGTLTTDGFDFSIKYRIPVTPWGQFSVGADFTHINKYDVKTDPNPLAMVETRHLAGQFDPAFGNFIKWRGNFSLDWSKGDWNAGYRMRWVGHGVIGSLDPGQNASADACNFVTNPYGICPGPVTMKIPNYFESYFTAGYNFGHIGTMDSRVDVGVDNAFDKSPPFIWSNLALNANTDVATYDTIGRLFWARFTAKF